MRLVRAWKKILLFGQSGTKMFFFPQSLPLMSGTSSILSKRFLCKQGNGSKCQLIASSQSQNIPFNLPNQSFILAPAEVVSQMSLKPYAALLKTVTQSYLSSYISLYIRTHKNSFSLQMYFHGLYRTFVCKKCVPS